MPVPSPYPNGCRQWVADPIRTQCTCASNVREGASPPSKWVVWIPPSEHFPWGNFEGQWICEYEIVGEAFCTWRSPTGYDPDDPNRRVQVQCENGGPGGTRKLWKLRLERPGECTAIDGPIPTSGFQGCFEGAVPFDANWTHTACLPNGPNPEINIWPVPFWFTQTHLVEPI